MRWTGVSALLIVLAVGTFHLFASRQDPTTVPDTTSPRPELPAAESKVAALTPEVVSTPDPPPRSAEERTKAIKAAMRRSVAGTQNRFIDQLVAKGLARSDSERMVNEFANGLVDCLFEAALADNKSRYTLDEFLHGAEMLWTNGTSQIDPQRVPTSAVGCAANVAQQAGLSIDFEPSNRRGTEPVVPASGMNAREMEATILGHIATHPELALTDLFVHCDPRGCEVLMQGRDIKIFDLEFDRFAEQHGFQRTVVAGEANFRTVWLQR
jgi:hypothetical protein